MAEGLFLEPQRQAVIPEPGDAGTGMLTNSVTMMLCWRPNRASLCSQWWRRMNVVFIDIDGVLNSRATAQKHGSHCIDPVLAAHINELVRATNEIVVLSSTHRLDQDLRCAILAAGIVFEGCTPDLPTQTRADEIAACLRSTRNYFLRGARQRARSGSPIVPNIAAIRIKQQALQSSDRALRKVR
jgi:hypothetical protein